MSITPPEPQENPYASPQAVDAPVGHSLPVPARSFAQASFLVGAAEPHVVAVKMSLLTGREWYRVDGVECLRTYSWWGRRRFQVGRQERHAVEVRISPLGRVRVLVDGVERERDLLPEIRWICTLSWVFVLLLLVAGAVLPVIGMLAFVSSRWAL